MARLIWTLPALSDLDNIADYIAIENPTAARKLVKRIFDAVERLEKHPNSGKIPADLGDSRYRELVCGPCRVFYRIRADEVVILFVMRSERALRAFMLQERDNLDR